MNKKDLAQLFQMRFDLIILLQITWVVSPFPGYPFSPNILEVFLFLRAYWLQSHWIFLLELSLYCDYICNIFWKKKFPCALSLCVCSVEHKLRNLVKAQESNSNYTFYSTLHLTLVLCFTHRNMFHTRNYYNVLQQIGCLQLKSLLCHNIFCLSICSLVVFHFHL